jgi:cold shock CspA family protein
MDSPGNPPRSRSRSPSPFKIPSPVPTRRERTTSTSLAAARTPQRYGTIKYFDRSKGHGFIHPDGGGEDIFVHISDIEGDYVPKAGDTVRFQTCPLPPKCEKLQAVGVVITSLLGTRHERWE